MKPDPADRKLDTINTGSPRSGEPVFLTIGKLRRTHGLKGDLVMDVLTDHPEMIIPGLSVFIGQKHKIYKIAEVRTASRFLLIRFEGFADCDQAAILRNQFVAVKSNETQPLEEGRFYQHEVIGLNVVEENGIAVGTMVEILSTGANDVYVVRPTEGEEILIPAVKEFIKKIDPMSRLITVRLPEWD